MSKTFLDPDEAEPATLSRDIVKRFLSEKQYNEFVAEYNLNKKGRGITNRFIPLSEPVSEQDWEIAKWYFNDKETSIAGKARELGIKETTFYNQIQPIIVKIAFQNKEKLGL